MDYFFEKVHLSYVITYHIKVISSSCFIFALYYYLIKIKCISRNVKLLIYA